MKKAEWKKLKGKNILTGSKFRLSLILVYLTIIIIALFYALQTTNNHTNEEVNYGKEEEVTDSSFFAKQKQFHDSIVGILDTHQIAFSKNQDSFESFPEGELIISLDAWFEDSAVLDEFLITLTKQVDIFRGKLVVQTPPPSEKADKILEIIFDDRLSHRITLSKKAIKNTLVNKLAIIIDDLGYNRETINTLAEIDKSLTISIIPYQKYSLETAKIAHQKGYEIMLHLPMEPEDYPVNDPGKGALLIHMSPEEIYKTTMEDISSLPYIKGVNNHMGSKATQDYQLMRTVLGIVKEKNLYFIDSRTTENTIAYKVAQELEVPTAIRTFFIDEPPLLYYTEKQLKSLYKYAEDNGYAIGIGHGYPTTIQALKNILPQMNDSEIKLVFASEIVH